MESAAKRKQKIGGCCTSAVAGKDNNTNEIRFIALMNDTRVEMSVSVSEAASFTLRTAIKSSRDAVCRCKNNARPQ